MARIGEPAPDISLSVAGSGRGEVKLTEQRGRVVLVNFWATWCAPCKSEMPALQALADELSPVTNGRFVLWAVNVQEDAEPVAQFGRDLGLRLPLLLDLEGDVTRSYNVRALPATFLVDRDGRLREQRLGAVAVGNDPVTPWTGAWITRRALELLAVG